MPCFIFFANIIIHSGFMLYIYPHLSGLLRRHCDDQTIAQFWWSNSGRFGINRPVPWWRHQNETFSALLALCAGNSPVPGEFPTQRPVTRSFNIFFDLRRINGWVNKCKAGDFRRIRPHYDVTVMATPHKNWQKETTAVNLFHGTYCERYSRSVKSDLTLKARTVK